MYCYAEPMKTSFDYHKAVQSINFMASKEGNTIDKFKLLKLLFFAERYHLRAYGRLIFFAPYWTMPLGPVCSPIKDIVEFSDSFSEKERTYAQQFLSPGDTSSHAVASTAAVDEDEFSDTDLTALEWAYEHFGHLSTDDLVERIHRYPEWTKYVHMLDIGMTGHANMDYSEFFENPVAGSPNDFNESSEHLALMQEIFQEEALIEQKPA